MTIAVLCSGVLGLLLFGLGVNVTRLRASLGQGRQFPDDPADPLFKAVRAHGNAAEYVPMLAVLALAAAARSPGGWVAGLVILATVGRIVHAVGLLVAPSMATNTPLRSAGALSTYIAGIGLSIVLLTTV